jgi:hypothetical protein
MAKNQQSGSKAKADSTSTKGRSSVTGRGTASKSVTKHAKPGSSYVLTDGRSDYVTKGQGGTASSKVVSAGKVTRLRPELEPQTVGSVPMVSEVDADESRYRPQIAAALAENACRLEEIERLQAHNRMAQAAQQATLERVQTLLEEIKTAA